MSLFNYEVGKFAEFYLLMVYGFINLLEIKKYKIVFYEVIKYQSYIIDLFQHFSNNIRQLYAEFVQVFVQRKLLKNEREYKKYGQFF